MATKNICMWCGRGKNKCYCIKKLLLTGIIAVVLGVSLWVGWLDLDKTVALVLILFGLKKIVQGSTYKNI